MDLDDILENIGVFLQTLSETSLGKVIGKKFAKTKKYRRFIKSLIKAILKLAMLAITAFSLFAKGNTHSQVDNRVKLFFKIVSFIFAIMNILKNK